MSHLTADAVFCTSLAQHTICNTMSYRAAARYIHWHSQQGGPSREHTDIYDLKCMNKYLLLCSILRANTRLLCSNSFFQFCVQVVWAWTSTSRSKMNRPKCVPISRSLVHGNICGHAHDAFTMRVMSTWCSKHSYRKDRVILKHCCRGAM